MLTFILSGKNLLDEILNIYRVLHYCERKNNTPISISTKYFMCGDINLYVDNLGPYIINYNGIPEGAKTFSSATTDELFQEITQEAVPLEIMRIMAWRFPVKEPEIAEELQALIEEKFTLGAPPLSMTLDDKAGFGNILIHLSDFVYHCCQNNREPVLKSPLWYVNGRIRVVNDGDIEEYAPNIYINPFTTAIIHPIMRHIVDLGRYKDIEPLADVGMHIRRGKYGKDSKHMGFGVSALFANNVALEKFEDGLKDACDQKIKVFLATDSLELKKELQEKYEYVVTRANSEDMKLSLPGVEVTDAYYEWLLLSKCKRGIYYTAGFANAVGLSTFGYTAGVYGNIKLYSVTNIKDA